MLKPPGGRQPTVDTNFPPAPREVWSPSLIAPGGSGARGWGKQGCTHVYIMEPNSESQRKG